MVNGHKCALHVSLTSVLRATAALSINRAKMRAIGLKYKNCHKIFYVSRESTILVFIFMIPIAMWENSLYFSRKSAKVRYIWIVVQRAKVDWSVVRADERFTKILHIQGV